MLWPFEKRTVAILWLTILYLLLNRATQAGLPIPVHAGADSDYKCMHYCDDPNSPEDN
jgi:hypothetical protein